MPQRLKLIRHNTLLTGIKCSNEVSVRNSRPTKPKIDKKSKVLIWIANFSVARNHLSHHWTIIESNCVVPNCVLFCEWGEGSIWHVKRKEGGGAKFQFWLQKQKIHNEYVNDPSRGQRVGNTWMEYFMLSKTDIISMPRTSNLFSF